MTDVNFDYERDEPGEFKLTRDELSQAVLFNTDWTVETAVSQLTKNNISLDPSFQRRDAWRLDKKSRFIESILLGLPVPQIVLAEDRHKRGQFIVLDGKQRLLTLLQFSGHAGKSEFNGFRLKDLQLLEELDGQDLQSLREDQKYDQYVQAFLNYPIRSSIIRNWPNAKYLETVFVRLNEGSLKLSPQELRQALSPGPFANFVDEFASQSVAMHHLLHNDGPDFRMRDTELLLRFLGFAMFPTTYAGDLKAFLDTVMDQLNATWGTRENEIRSQVLEIDEALRFGTEVLGDKAFARKWDTKSRDFSPFLNRAVAEIEVFYFKNPYVRDWVQSHGEEFKNLLSSLIDTDTKFKSSLESTTKSLNAVGTRFEVFGSALQAKVSGRVEVLRLLNGRLSFL